MVGECIYYSYYSYYSYDEVVSVSELHISIATDTPLVPLWRAIDKNGENESERERDVVEVSQIESETKFGEKDLELHKTRVNRQVSLMIKV